MKNMTVKIIGISLALSFMGTTGTSLAEKVKLHPQSEVKLIKHGQGHGSHSTSLPYVTENDRAGRGVSNRYGTYDKKSKKAQQKLFKELKKSQRQADKQRKQEARLAAIREAQRKRLAEERAREALRLAEERRRIEALRLAEARRRREAARLAAIREAELRRREALSRGRVVKCLCHGTHTCSAHGPVVRYESAPSRTCEVIVKPAPRRVITDPGCNDTYTGTTTVDSQGKVRTRNALLIAAAANEIFNKSTKSKGDIRRGTLAGVLVNELFHK